MTRTTDEQIASLTHGLDGERAVLLERRLRRAVWHLNQERERADAAEAGRADSEGVALRWFERWRDRGKQARAAEGRLTRLRELLIIELPNEESLKHHCKTGCTHWACVTLRILNGRDE